MKIQEDQIEHVINFGAFNYDAAKIASILDLDVKDVEREMKRESSELRRLLQKGQDMADYNIDKKLFDMAKAGDIKAMEKLAARRRVNKRP
jgi:hypothetical protein